jgi:hypothetical protein
MVHCVFAFKLMFTYLYFFNGYDMKLLLTEFAMTQSTRSPNSFGNLLGNALEGCRSLRM